MTFSKQTTTVFEFFIYDRRFLSILIYAILFPAFCHAKSKPQHDLDGIDLSQIQNEKLSRLILTKNVAIQFDAAQRLLDSGFANCPLLSLKQLDIGEEVLAISIASKNNSVKLEFGLGQGLKKVVVVNAPLNDDTYQKILFVLGGTMLTVAIDCKQLIRINDHDLTRFGSLNPNVFNYHLFIANHHDNSCVQIRELTVDAGETLESKCANLEVLLDNEADAFLFQSASSNFSSSLPSNEDFHNTFKSEPVNEISSEKSRQVSVQERIEHLQKEVEHWSVLFQKFESRIKKVELIQRGCRLGVNQLVFGQKLQFSENCTECQCSSGGELHCGPIGCQKLECQHPINVPGKCCPHCGHQCLYNGRHYENGEEFWPKQCVRCWCNNRHVECQFRQTPNCPPLDCPEHQQETPPNQCCPVCKNLDFCDSRRNPCHADAICESGPYSALCKCKTGFFGNGTVCYDIDECGWDENAREMLNGCRMGTLCINLPGSFKCECGPGFQKLDDRTCLDIIRT